MTLFRLSVILFFFCLVFPLIFRRSFSLSVSVSDQWEEDEDDNSISSVQDPEEFNDPFDETFDVIDEEDDTAEKVKVIPTPSPLKKEKKPIITPQFDDEDDDEDHELDDEFDHTPPSKNKPSKPSSVGVNHGKSPGAALASPSGYTFGSLAGDQAHFYYEYSALLFIILYIINYGIGSRQNEKIAKQFYDTVNAHFQQQFAGVGVYELVASDPNNPNVVTPLNNTPAIPTGTWSGEGGLMKESSSVFKFYCSGRRNCYGYLATLNLRPRHCLFSLLLSVIDFAVADDTVAVEVPMNDEAFPPVIFAICRKKSEKKFKKSFKDLESYAQIRSGQASAATAAANGASINSAAILPNQFSILTDCVEVETELIDERLCKLLREEKTEKYFHSVHLTDQNQTYLSSFPVPSAATPAVSGSASSSSSSASSYSVTPYKKVLRFRFYLPSLSLAVTEYSNLIPLFNWSFSFIDRTFDLHLSVTAKKKAEEGRKRLAEKEAKEKKKEREEELKRQREEKKKKEEGTMDPDQLAKIQKKKEEKTLRKKQARVKILR